MRIAHVVTLISPDGAYGGPVRVAMNQAKELIRQGHEVVIFGGSSGYKEAPHSIDDVPLVLHAAFKTIPGAGFAGLIAPGLLLKLVSQLSRFDLVHIHFARDFVTLPIAAAMSALRIPFVLQTHGMVDRSTRWLARPLDLLVTRPVLRSADRVFHLTELERNHLLEVEPSTSNLTHLVNGVPDVPPTEDRSASNEVLFLARLQARKQPLAFVQAAAELIPRYPSTLFSLVGPDEGEGAAVAALIAEIGSPHLTWEGALPPGETLDRMRRASVYVLPSVNEPFPMSVLEAISVGTPVIIRDSCGVAPHISSTRSGVVVGDGENELTEALEGLLDNPSLRAEMSTNAQSCAKEIFSMETVGEVLISSYESVVAKKSVLKTNRIAK